MGKRFGPVLLATVGLVLVVGALALITLPELIGVSGLVVFPGLAVLGVGVRLVLLAAFFEDADGEANHLGIWFRFRHRSGRG